MSQKRIQRIEQKIDRIKRALLEIVFVYRVEPQ